VLDTPKRQICRGGHDAVIFCVELAAVVVHDRPDRSDGYAADVEWNQQAFIGYCYAWHKKG
jgi:hypothetical protein